MPIAKAARDLIRMDGDPNVRLVQRDGRRNGESGKRQVDPKSKPRQRDMRPPTSAKPLRT